MKSEMTTNGIAECSTPAICRDYSIEMEGDPNAGWHYAECVLNAALAAQGSGGGEGR